MKFFLGIVTMVVGMAFTVPALAAVGECNAPRGVYNQLVRGDMAKALKILASVNTNQGSDGEFIIGAIGVGNNGPYVECTLIDEIDLEGDKGKRRFFPPRQATPLTLKA